MLSDNNNNNEVLKINMSTIVNRWNSSTELLNNSIEELASSNLYEISREEREVILMRLFEDVRLFLNYWTNYTSKYSEAFERDIIDKDKRIKQLEAQLMDVIKHNRQLIKEVNDLKEERENAFKNVYQEMYDKMPSADELLALIKEQKETLDKIKSKFDAVDNLVNKVDKNKGFFINQEAVKEKVKVKVDRHGENAPAFKQDIDNSEIERDIKDGVSISDMSKKYGMTYQGMKYRVNKVKEKMEVEVNV